MYLNSRVCTLCWKCYAVAIVYTTPFLNSQDTIFKYIPLIRQFHSPFLNFNFPSTFKYSLTTSSHNKKREQPYHITSFTKHQRRASLFHTLNWSPHDNSRNEMMFNSNPRLSSFIAESDKSSSYVNFLGTGKHLRISVVLVWWGMINGYVRY